LDSGCQPVVAKADRLFRKSKTGERKRLQTQRILCSTAVELEMHMMKNIEPLLAIATFQGETRKTRS
jgi:hypothetical protein